MLSRLANLDEVGQYAVGPLRVRAHVLTAFGLAYNPFVLSLSRRTGSRKQVRATPSRTAIVLTGLSVALALFAREATTVIAPGYDGAYRVVGALCLGVTIFGLSAITMTGISLVRRTGYFAVYSLVALVVNVVPQRRADPAARRAGAAIATAIAYAALTMLYYRKAQELYFTPYEPRKVLTVLIAGAACMPLAFLPLGAGFTAVKVAGAGGLRHRPLRDARHRPCRDPRAQAPGAPLQPASRRERLRSSPRHTASTMPLQAPPERVVGVAAQGEVAALASDPQA